MARFAGDAISPRRLRCGNSVLRRRRGRRRGRRWRSRRREAATACGVRRFRDLVNGLWRGPRWLDEWHREHGRGAGPCAVQRTVVRPHMTALSSNYYDKPPEASYCPRTNAPVLDETLRPVVLGIVFSCFT